MPPKCRDLVYSYDSLGFREWINRRFGVDIGPDLSSAILDRSFNEWTRLLPATAWEDEDTWAMWIANRLVENGLSWLFKHRNGFLAKEWGPTCTMHVFFLRLEETEEHLKRLRYDPDFKSRSTIAVSKIERTNLATINPINRVAARG